MVVCVKAEEMKQISKFKDPDPTCKNSKTNCKMISLEEASTTNPQPSTKGGQTCDATASKICQYCNAILDSFPDLIHHIKAQHIGWLPCEDAAENDLWAEELLEKLCKKRNKFDDSNKEAKGLLVMVAHSHAQDLTRWIVLPNQKHSDPQEKKKDPAMDSNQWPSIPHDDAPDSNHISQKDQTHVLKDKVYANSKQPCVNTQARVRKHKLVKDENDDESKLGVQIKFKRWCGEAEICDKPNQATSIMASSGRTKSSCQSSTQSVLGLQCSQAVSKPAAIVQPLSASAVKPSAVSLNSSKKPPKSDEVVTKVSFFTLEGAGGTHIYYFCHHCSQVFKSHSDFKRHSEEVKARSRNDPIQGTPSPNQSIRQIKSKPSPLGTANNSANIQDGNRQLSQSVHNSQRASNIAHSKSSSKKHKRSSETRAESGSSLKKKKKKKKKKHRKHRQKCKCAPFECLHSSPCACPDAQSTNSVEPNQTSVVTQSSNLWPTIFPTSLTGQNSQATPQAAKFQYLPVSRELMSLPQTSQFGFAHFTMPQQATQLGSISTAMPQVSQLGSTYLTRPQQIQIRSGPQDSTQLVYSTNVPIQNPTQLGAVSQQISQPASTNVSMTPSAQLASINVSKPQPTQLQQSASLGANSVMKPQSTQLNSINVPKPQLTQLDYTSATLQQSAQLGATNEMKPQSTQLNSTNVSKPIATQLDYTSVTFQQSAQLGATNVIKPQSTQLDSTNIPKPQPTQLLYTSATFKQSAQLDSTNVSKPHATELCSTNATKAHSAPLGNTIASKTKGTDLWSANVTKPQIASLDSVNVSKQPSTQPCLNSVSSAQDTQPNSPNVTRPVSSATKQQASEVGSADATKLQGVHLSLSNITDPKTSQPVIIKLAKQQAAQLGLTSATMPQASKVGSANVPKLQRVRLSSSNITKSQATPPVIINTTKQQATQLGITSATMPKASEEVSAYYSKLQGVRLSSSKPQATPPVIINATKQQATILGVTSATMPQASEEVSAYYPKLQGVRLSSSKPQATPPVFFNVTKQQATQLGFTYATMPQASNVGSANVPKLQRVRLSSSNITEPQATPPVIINATKQQATQLGVTSATMPQASKVGSANVPKLQRVQLTQVGSINVAKPQVAQLDTANVREQPQTIQPCVNSVKRAQGPQPNSTNDTRSVSSGPKSQASVNVAKLQGVQLSSTSITKPQMTQLGSSYETKQQATQLSSSIVKKSHIVGPSSSNVTRPQVAQLESTNVAKLKGVQLSSTNMNMQQAAQQGSTNVTRQQATQLGSTNVTMLQSVQLGPTNTSKPKTTQHDSINLTQYALAALQSNKPVARQSYTNIPILQGVQLMTLREASQQGSTNVTGQQATQPGSTNVTMPQSVRLDSTNKAKPKATQLGSIDLTNPQDAGLGYTNVTKLQNVQHRSTNMTMTQTSQQVSVCSNTVSKSLTSQPSSASVKRLQSTQLHSGNMTKFWDAEPCSSVTTPLVAQLNSNSADITKSLTTQSSSTAISQQGSTNVTEPQVSKLSSTNITRPKAMQLGFSNVTLMSLPTKSTGIKHSNIDTATVERTKLAKSKSAMATTTLLGSTTTVKPQSTTPYGSPAAVPKASQNDFDSFRTQFEIDFPTRTSQSSGQFAPTKGKLPQKTGPTTAPGSLQPLTNIQQFTPQLKVHMAGASPQSTQAAATQSTQGANVASSPKYFQIVTKPPVPQSETTKSNSETNGKEMQNSGGQNTINKAVKMKDSATKDSAGCPVDEQNMYPCPDCFSSFQNPIALRFHMAFDHYELSVIRCWHCSAKYSDKWSLESHILEKHKVCCRYCPKMISQSWQKPFQPFGEEASIELHEKIKHGKIYVPRSRSRQRQMAMYMTPLCSKKALPTSHTETKVPSDTAENGSDGRGDVNRNNNSASKDTSNQQVFFVVQGDKVTVKKTPNAYRSKTSKSDSIETESQVKGSSSTQRSTAYREQLNPTATLPLPVSADNMAPGKFVIKRVGPNNHIVGQRTWFHKRPHQPGVSADAVQSSSQILEGGTSSGSTEEDDDVILIEPTSSTEILEHMQRTMAQKNIPLSVKAKIANFLLEKISKIHKEEAEMTRRNKTGVFSCQYCNKKFLSFQPVKYHEAMHETKDLMNSSFL